MPVATNDSYATTLNTSSVQTPLLWASSWEDDLLMTGVRSFDVKAYEPVAKFPVKIEDDAIYTRDDRWD